MREWIGLHHVTQPRPAANRAFRYFRRGLGCGLLVGIPAGWALVYAAAWVLAQVH